MKKIIFSLLFLVFIMAGCGLNGERSEISKEIGVNVSEGNEILAMMIMAGFTVMGLLVSHYNLKMIRF